MGRTVDEELLDTPTYKLLMDRFRISKERLVEMMNAHEVDPDVFEKLMSSVLSRYRSLDVYGSKAALQREIEKAIEAASNQDREDDAYVA
ncbi:MAG TPA: hypothetical protein PK156_17760 [Polyangium sp.]|nr:hypothetical protein [Polyangium sp.]